MIKISENFSLKAHNTFNVEAQTRYFVDVTETADLSNLITDARLLELPWLVLGGGSNMLFSKDFPGVIIKPQFKWIQLTREDSEYYYLNVGSGTVWNDLVRYCLDHDYFGIENLIDIPGTVGAAPVQNIGAYGVEFKDVFDSLRAFNLQTGAIQDFNKTQCEFGYRQSIFKSDLKNQFLIISVNLCLTKKPKFVIDYSNLKQRLEQDKTGQINAQIIARTISQIRAEKLPDPEKLGNAGSFFKNPVIPFAQFEELKQAFPKIVWYPDETGKVKLAAAWLIEQCGWKGKRKDNVGVHEKQALVLVNYGSANGKDIESLAREIQYSMIQKFGIQLETEVNIV